MATLPDKYYIEELVERLEAAARRATRIEIDIKEQAEPEEIVTQIMTIKIEGYKELPANKAKPIPWSEASKVLRAMYENPNVQAVYKEQHGI